MNKIIKPAVTLLIITVISSFCLAYVYAVTKDPIHQQKVMAEEKAMQKVFPHAKSFPPEGIIKNSDPRLANTSIIKVVPAQDESGLCGYVLTTKGKGYGGDIELVVGIDLNANVTGMTILSHTETPGLGANATTDAFTSQFKGKTSPLTVVKSSETKNNEISAITGATITTKAVSGHVEEAINWVKENGGAES